jgi:hypothetical protein
MTTEFVKLSRDRVRGDVEGWTPLQNPVRRALAPVSSARSTQDLLAEMEYSP